jgi:hypothetical protein
MPRRREGILRGVLGFLDVAQGRQGQSEHDVL